ncbi:MAG: DinB family protein [Acidobacteriota bacterium]
MADLLECLVQVRALRETSKRLEALLRSFPLPLWIRREPAGTATASEVVARLADAELLSGTWLRLMLTVEQPVLRGVDRDALAARARYAEWPPLLALSRFRTRREETLELLEGCDAEDLARIGRHSERGEITVADLVAMMLAHDTDRLGEIRERLELTVRTAGSEGDA